MSSGGSPRSAPGASGGVRSTPCSGLCVSGLPVAPRIPPCPKIPGGFSSTLLKLLGPCSSLCLWAWMGFMGEIGAQVLENKPGECGGCCLRQSHTWHLWEQGNFDACSYPKMQYFHGEEEEAPWPRRWDVWFLNLNRRRTKTNPVTDRNLH